MLAVSAFQVGHARHDAVLRYRGVELYGVAIRTMSRALQTSQSNLGSITFDLEMAGFALALYEVRLERLGACSCASRRTSLIDMAVISSSDRKCLTSTYGRHL